MALSSTTLRPGLLVSLKTSVTGNVKYRKNVLEGQHIADDGSEQSRWETERTISDPQEHAAAVKARSKARAVISGVCAKSAFGLLCPEQDGDKLEAAIAAARKVADEFNDNAALSRLGVYVITGRIAPDDVEAVRAINAEVRDLLATMEDGVKNLDVKTIREAANEARNLGNMLTPSAQASITVAIEAARKVARDIKKAGDAAVAAVDYTLVRRITEQRTMFLDLSEVKPVATPEGTVRNVDVGPLLEVVEYTPSTVNAPKLEITE